jgi:hypothetical protein
MNRYLPGLVLAGFVAMAGCSDPNALLPASISNVVDTVKLWTLSHGPLNDPTAYSLNARNGVRTWDIGPDFEFAFDVDASGRMVFLPIDLLGLLSSNAFKPGLKPVGTPFDQMTKAPLNGYVTSDTVPVVLNQTYYLRSSVSTCASLGVPLYGKFQVIEIDSAAQTVKLQVLADQNCGYRGLNLGIPKS